MPCVLRVVGHGLQVLRMLRVLQLMRVLVVLRVRRVLRVLIVRSLHRRMASLHICRGGLRHRCHIGHVGPGHRMCSCRTCHGH